MTDPKPNVMTAKEALDEFASAGALAYFTIRRNEGLEKAESSTDRHYAALATLKALAEERDDALKRKRWAERKTETWTEYYVDARQDIVELEDENAALKAELAELRAFKEGVERNWPLVFALACRPTPQADPKAEG